MFLQKDELSKFDFITVKGFLLALFLMLCSAIFSFTTVPLALERVIQIKSHYFQIFIFFLSQTINFLIIYYFACVRQQKTLKEGLFFYSKSNKVYLISLLIGVLMPLATLPIIFKFAPEEFYAVDLVKSKAGIIYLFTCALSAPLFEEIFYRGFIFPFFQSKLNSFWAVVITSVFFGLSHFMNTGNAYILLSLFIFYGFVLTLIRYFTNSLIQPMITHFVHNATLIICFLASVVFPHCLGPATKTIFFSRSLLIMFSTLLLIVVFCTIIQITTL
ncbi:MAG: CPBP family intramembrane metalloprotease [Candidatus Melainabacteria bacterium]|nr:CPBP family intramembrane metalloprotease [Candidatus Melainabacteria bacterium]